MKYILILILGLPVFGQSYSTNVPAALTITILTNVVNGDNATGCNLCYDAHGNWKGVIAATWPPSNCTPFHPATEKWIITNIVQRTEFWVNGRQINYVEESLLSSVTNRWKLDSEWKKEN